MRPFLVFGISFAATMLSTMGGGSSSALTIPSWLAMGVPLPLAIATDKVAGVVWTALGARNYLRGREADWRLLGWMAGLGVLGAWFGTRVTLTIDPAPLKRGVGAVILLLVAVLLARPRLGRHPGPPKVSRPLFAAVALPLGFYDGMFGAGNTLITALLFCAGRGYDLIGALGHFYVLAFVWTAFAAGVYVAHGHHDLALMLPATLGGAGGGYLGSRFASRRGAGFVRGLFAVAGTVFGFKLLLGF